MFEVIWLGAHTAIGRIQFLRGINDIIAYCKVFGLIPPETLPQPLIRVSANISSGLKASYRGKYAGRTSALKFNFPSNFTIAMSLFELREL